MHLSSFSSSTELCLMDWLLNMFYLKCVQRQASDLFVMKIELSQKRCKALRTLE